MKRTWIVPGLWASAMIWGGCMHAPAVKPATAENVAATSTSESNDTEPLFSDVTHVQDAADDASVTSLDSRVTRVTVYSDRARVTREASTVVNTDAQVFVFNHLPGWVDDGSVRVKTSAGRIVDVRVERHYLANSTDSTYQKVEKEHQSLRAKLDALNDELVILDAQKTQIENIKGFSIEKINEEMQLGDIKIETYGQVIEFISSSLRKTAAARRKVEQQIATLTPEFAASERRMAELQNLQSLEETAVQVTLQSSRSASAVVSLTYMLPGVTWEPMHELRVSTQADKKVEVISFAVVTQTSGEDWGNAELSFATQSSVESVRIPELEALTLGDTTTAKRMLTQKTSSFLRAQQAFEGQSQLWNSLHQNASMASERVNFDKMFQSNLEYLQVVQSKTIELFETLQKRGTTEHFKAMTTPSVRGDGHPVRMRIGVSELSSIQKIVAAPEQSLNAARTLEMTNSTRQSFLPGNVSLYQDGAFLGITELDFIAPGETFSIFLSVADHIKLSRTLDKKQSSFIRRKRNQMTVAFVVAAENLSGSTTQLRLADRIPVSENKAIRVEGIKISPSAKPDSRGIIYWDVTLKPGERRVFNIAYKVEYPSELVLETRRKKLNEQMSASEPPSPIMKSSPKASFSSFDDYSFEAAEPDEIGEQLMNLEDNF